MLRPVNSSAIRASTDHKGKINNLQWMGGVIGEGVLINERPDDVDTRHAFAKFSPHELAFMSLRGIPIVDLQSGCSNQCFGCGCDADELNPQNAMSPERIKVLVKSASGLQTLGYNLFPRSYFDTAYPTFARTFSLLLFFGSDLVNYRALDEDGQEWTMYDAVDRFQRAFGVRMVFTTAGWKPGDNFRSRAIEQLVDRMENDEKFSIGRTYSMKMLGRRACKEYDEFMESLVQQEFSVTVDELISNKDGMSRYEKLSKDHADDFVKGSQHVAFMIDNMRTLLRKGKLNIAASAVPYPHTLDELDQRYRHLFSKDMLEIVRAHCERALGDEAGELRFISQFYRGSAANSQKLLGGTSVGLLTNLRDMDRGLLGWTELYDSDHHDSPGEYSPAAFRLTDIRGGSMMSARAFAMQLGWKQPGDTYLDLYRFYSQLNSRGAISIWFGKSASNFGNIRVPREYFVARAAYHESKSTGSDDHATMANHYRMLAGLIGKNIFG